MKRRRWTTVDRRRRDPRRAERGSVMVLVMIILVSLLAGGAIALQLQLSSTKQVGFASSSRRSLYCAEAGLARARGTIANFQALWNNMIDSDPTNDPTWYPIVGDIDDPPDGVNDFEVTLRDNDDEPVGSNDPNVDSDLRVFIVSRCTKYPDTPKEVLELAIYNRGADMYRNQSGQGAGNTGNAN
jgi:hypothetical protein